MLCMFKTILMCFVCFIAYYFIQVLLYFFVLFFEIRTAWVFRNNSNNNNNKTKNNVNTFVYSQKKLVNFDLKMKIISKIGNIKLIMVISVWILPTNFKSAKNLCMLVLKITTTWCNSTIIQYLILSVLKINKQKHRKFHLTTCIRNYHLI